jgi:hypothetical protein
MPPDNNPGISWAKTTSRASFNDVLVNAVFVAKMRSDDRRKANSRRNGHRSTAAILTRR